MPRATLVAADLRHVLAVADQLRQADRDELAAAHGMDLSDMETRRALLCAAAAAGPCLAAVDAGVPLAVLGCAPVSLVGGVAAPWLLATPGADRYGRDLLVAGRALVEQWGRDWVRLENRADARNTRTLRWLQRIGFTLEDPQPWGALGMPFVRFHRCA